MKIIDLNKLQKQIYKNKVDKGFNITDINKEFIRFIRNIRNRFRR